MKKNHCFDDKNKKEWDVTVVMPVYNEEAIISEVVADWVLTLRQLNLKFRLAVYNDGSRDKTAQKLKWISLKYPELQVINKANSGHGPTILSGYREQAESSEWLVQIDSDNEIPAKIFPYFWEHRHEFDFLLGKRATRESPWSRSLISWTARRLIQGGRLVVHDVNCPFRLMRSDAFRNLFHQISHKSFAPNVMITAYAIARKKRVTELSVPYHERQTGEVSIKHWKLLRAAILSGLQTLSFLTVLRFFPSKMKF